MTKTLEDLRKEIDDADEQLLLALAKRFSVIREIGKLKKEHNITPLDEKRWNEVLNKIITISKKYTIPENLVKKIYEEIHISALKIEKDDE